MASYMDIADAYPKFEQRQFYWIDPFNDKASDEHHAIKRKIRKKNTLHLRISIVRLNHF